MSRRRLIELLVALGVLLLLLAVFLVRPTARKTGVPPVQLFQRASGTPPDFGTGSYAALTAAAPDSQRVLVLYPVEFEERADLYVVPRGGGDGYRLVLEDSVRAQDTPKAIGWLDHTHAWVTVGPTYGTVSPGGDLYALDPASGLAASLWVSPDSGRTQAVGFTPPNVVRLKVFDANMDHPRDSTVTLTRAPTAW